MLRLRLSVESGRADRVAEALDGTGGVRRLVSAPDQVSAGEVVISADVIPRGADQVMAVLEDLEVSSEDYLLARVDVVAPGPVGVHRSEDIDDVAWIEVVEEARANARPLARYLALMTVAGLIAGLGVITGNVILIVGAMAVSPDLLPICSICVGIVGRRIRLARRASVTLAVGLAITAVVAAAVTLLLDLTGILSGDFKVGEGTLGALANVDYSTVLVALCAGVAAMLSFETRASAAVGVAISVTTIPASAYLGVAAAAGEPSNAGGAALVLAVNVALLIVSGCITLAVQRRLGVRRPEAGVSPSL
ncbi:MAG: DUF389 domain-containing protein [Solirubrobacterales bacterium]